VRYVEEDCDGETTVVVSLKQRDADLTVGCFANGDFTNVLLSSQMPNKDSKQVVFGVKAS